MKVLGYVNRYNRGIVRVQKELEENGNGKAIFDLNLITAFKVIEPISTRANSEINELTDKQLKILEYCKEARSREEILTFVGLSNQTKNFIKHVIPLIEAQLLAYTKPERSDVRGQQYILTEFGNTIFNKEEDE